MAFQVQFISSKLISNCVCMYVHQCICGPLALSRRGVGVVAEIGSLASVGLQIQLLARMILNFQFSCFSLPSTGNTGLHYQVLGVKPKGLCMVCKHRTNWVTSLIEKLVWPRSILPFLPKTHTAFSYPWCSFNSLYWQSGPEILARQLPLPHESVPLFMWRWWVPPGLVITQVSTP